MAEEKDIHEETQAPAEEEVFETYYDDDEAETQSRWHFKPGDVACDAARRVHDGVLKFLPVEVTEHLANSQKELIKAGVALAEAGMRRTDDTVKRARELHEEA